MRAHPRATTYRGMRDTDGRCVIEVQPAGVAIGYPLAHKVRHSPAGFEWGYTGSGPADTARSLLTELLGWIPHPIVYQRFKLRRIAALGISWELSAEEIRADLAAIAYELGIRCLRCADSAIAEDENDDRHVCPSCEIGRAYARELEA